MVRVACQLLLTGYPFLWGFTSDHLTRNLSKLSSSVKSYSPEFALVFPRHTANEKRLFNLVKAAYVQARYNSEFDVTKDDIDALLPKVELLRNITKCVCEAKIKEYELLEHAQTS